MALALQPADKINFFGDSITQGVGQGTWYGPYITSVNATYTKAGTVLVNQTATATTARPTVTTSPSLAPSNFSPTVVNAGVSGNKLSDLIARVNTDVIATNPTVVIIEVGINDVIAGTNPATFGTNAASLLSTIKASLPTVRLAWVSCLCYGESYPDTTWGSSIDAINAQIQTAIVNAGGTYIDVRTPQQTYESIHNTPPPGAITGILCLDNPTNGIHPNSTAGIPLMSNAAFAVTTINGAPT